MKIHVTPARGKLVDKITLNGVELPASVYADGVITLTPEESHGSSSNINVTFRDREKQSISVKTGFGGTIERKPSGSTVYEGETLTVTPKPSYGYVVDTVTLNGVPMTEADGKYSAVLGAGNYVLEVTFKEKAAVPPPSVEQPEEEGFPAWGIALIAVGGVLVLAGAGSGVFFGLKKAKKGSKTEADEEQPQDKQD